MKWIKKYLTDQEIQKVSDSVQAAEAKTSGEIVPMIVLRSSTVGHVPLTLSLILILFTFFIEFSWKEIFFAAPWIYAWPFLAVFYFIISIYLGRLHILQRILTPNYDEAFQVYQRAQLEFFLNGINKTNQSTGVLIFISIMERRAVILADKGISSKIPQEFWDKQVAELTGKMRAGQWSLAFEKCIADCGQVLAEHFPATNNTNNELSNKLIIKN